MKTVLAATFSVVLALGMAGCERAISASGLGPNVVEVTASGLNFEAPDEVASGWTTFRLKNESGMVHFAIVERLPEGIDVDDHQEEVAPVFQKGMDLLNAGDADAALAVFGELPGWFGEVVFTGGPGLVAPNRTAEATVYLTPGTYMLECYVKTGGVFHSFNPDPEAWGMVHEFVVTADSSGAPMPAADIVITISSEEGIQVEGDTGPGEHTVAVHFDDQIVHEHFVGHDVHLARIDETTDLDELQTWMDWTQPTGLQTAAPVEFLGGTNDMPAGETAYFTVELEPGDYAWIAEVPNAAEKGMLRTFTVPSE